MTNIVSITIATTMLQANISSTAKLLYGAIIAVHEKYGVCDVPNEEFMKMFDWPESTIVVELISLKTDGYIKVSKKKGTRIIEPLYFAK